MIREVSNLNSNRLVTRYQAIRNVDRRDKRKWKIKEKNPMPIIISIDPLFKGSDFEHNEEVIEEEADHPYMQRKRKALLGSDWVKKLEKEKNEASITDIAHIEEVNTDIHPLSTSDITHVDTTQISKTQVINPDSLISNTSNPDYMNTDVNSDGEDLKDGEVSSLN